VASSAGSRGTGDPPLPPAVRGRSRRLPVRAQDQGATASRSSPRSRRTSCASASKGWRTLHQLYSERPAIRTDAEAKLQVPCSRYGRPADTWLRLRERLRLNNPIASMCRRDAVPPGAQRHAGFVRSDNGMMVPW
jgi:hypothetical protein